MNMPGFTAEVSLYKLHAGYSVNRRFADSHANTVVPAIPFCGNCDEILDRCSQNGGRPRAVCRACAIGDCFSGVEKPPFLLDPFGHHPGGF
ncbi:MAG: hypothetical protein ND866_03475 [Pyrinomonadaceae bacterium]|nr:hypothetical protein [Pyrinomonadaceae bacterium]